MRNSHILLIIIGLLVRLAGPACADIPPPRQFSDVNKVGKSKTVLIIDTSHPSGSAKDRSASVYDTQAFCRVAIDLEFTAATRGVFRVQGSGTGALDVGPEAPYVDEAKPVKIANNTSASTILSIDVPLRHNVTMFEWVPDKDSPGQIQIWATALPCAAGWPAE